MVLTARKVQLVLKAQRELTALLVLKAQLVLTGLPVQAVLKALQEQMV